MNGPATQRRQLGNSIQVGNCTLSQRLHPDVVQWCVAGDEYIVQMTLLEGESPFLSV